MSVDGGSSSHDVNGVGGAGSEAIAHASRSQLHNRLIAESSPDQLGPESAAAHLRNALQLLAPLVEHYLLHVGDPAALWQVEDEGEFVNAAANRIRAALEQLEAPAPRRIVQVSTSVRPCINDVTGEPEDYATDVVAVDNRGFAWFIAEADRRSVATTSRAWIALPALPPIGAQRIGSRERTTMNDGLEFVVSGQGQTVDVDHAIDTMRERYEGLEGSEP